MAGLAVAIVLVVVTVFLLLKLKQGTALLDCIAAGHQQLRAYRHLEYVGRAGYFSVNRGMISTKLQGRWRMSSCHLRMPSQPSFTAPGEPGRAKR